MGNDISILIIVISLSFGTEIITFGVEIIPH